MSQQWKSIQLLSTTLNIIDKNQMIYLDYQSTTPIDKRVIDEMSKANAMLGNPHSNTHRYGLEAGAMVEDARSKVAHLINASPKSIIFTSGATESNNLSIKGFVEFNATEDKNHLITTTIEHKCIIETFRYLEKKGYQVTYIKPNKKGIIELSEIKKAIKKSTLLMSVIHLHNEMGVIQDIESIGKLAKQHNIAFHTDAAQSFGKIPIDVEKMNIDLMSISGHKIYGPKGIGALFIKTKPRIRITPLFHGGGQERGMRSGTIPMPLVHGLGVAAEIAEKEMKSNFEKITKLGKKLWNGLSKIEEVYLNGDEESRFFGNVNVSFGYIEGESLMALVPNVALSSGSACTSSTLETSYVLHSMNINDMLAHSSIRFGIGKFTTEEEIDEVIESFTNAVTKLRKISPIWEMYKEGIDINTIEWSEH